jgi:hypothetical protein
LDLFLDDVVAEFNAFVTDEYRRPRNKLLYFLLALRTKRAVKELAALFGLVEIVI